MPRTPHKPAKPGDLPVLTERPEATTKIPVLTDTLAEVPAPALGQPAIPLTEAQCRELAVRLAPQLESMLRDKLARQFDALWESSWREIKGTLPDLIRDQLGSGRRSAK